MSTRTPAKTFALEYLKTIGILSVFKGRGFAYPYDLAIGRDRSLFVLNRGFASFPDDVRVSICTFDEDFLGEFGHGHGSGDGQLAWPVSMAFDGRDTLYVSDERNHRVTVFDTTGKYLSKWGVFGSGDGELNGPAGIAFDADDNLYVVDQNNHRVQKFTTDGRYILQWGELGDGEGQLNLPWGVTLDSRGDVYVADWRNDRIQKFTPAGEFLASFGEPGAGDGQFHRPSSVTVDPEGYIYVADWGNERVQVLGPDGSFLLKLRGQATLSTWAQEFFDANSDEKTARDRADLVPELPPHLNTPAIISAQTEPYFWGPVSVKLDEEGRLYVIESNRHRIQVFQRVP